MANAFEQNYEACLSAFAAASGTVDRDEELTVGLSDIPGRTFNGVFRGRFHRERTSGEISARVAAVLRRFTERARPMRWLVGPSTLPAELGTYLTAAGIAAVGEHPAMGFDLVTIPDEPAPPDLRIEHVLNPNDTLRFAQVSTEGFGGPQPPLDHPAVRIFARAMAKAPLARGYLGWLGDEAVATCASYYAAGVVGLYSVATLPQARRRGFGRAMTLAALRDAREQGYRVAVLESSEIGEPVYSAIGFRQVYALPGYLWTPPNR
jgi:ribosomal protein S18 acetylase RimI-like enzyme